MAVSSPECPSGSVSFQLAPPIPLITAFDYDLRMPGFRQQPLSKVRMIVIVLLFVLVFVLVRLGLFR